MKYRIISIAFLLIILITSCNNNSHINNTNDPIGVKVDSVLALMTIKEKVGQLNQYNGFWGVTGPSSGAHDKEKLEMLKAGGVGAMLNVTSTKHTREAQQIVMENSRLKIPLIFGYDVIHGYKTMFPIPLGESASWDLEIIKNSARIAAKEASASGIHWTFAPMVDIARDARWGRIMEGAGEDPYLGSQIAIARVKGFQGDDLSSENSIAACAKHFAGYGLVEGGRDYNTVSLGDANLHNIILPPFKAAADAGVATFMTAFNDINGIPATAHKELLTNVLKEDWQWKGFVVSDWQSISEMMTHGYVKDNIDAAELAFNAGCDMDMEARSFEEGLELLISQNKVDILKLDEAVKRILRVKFQLGLFDDPYRYCNEDRERSDVYSKENLAAAKDAGKKSIVLLKNENNILPLQKNINNIAVIGALAADKDTPLGSWRAMVNANTAVSFLEGVQQIVSPNTKVSYSKGVDVAFGERNFVKELDVNRDNLKGIEDAVRVAKNADVVLLTLGEEAFMSGEGRSQVDIQLTMPQQKLLEAVNRVNKNIVLVLMNGRPLILTNIENKVLGILETWHLGSESGNAIAEVVFGDYNPSGKLPVSFPKHVGQSPLYYNHKMTGRPNDTQDMVFYSHYTDESKKPLYPFGYGLSYTTFEYSDLSLDTNTLTLDGSLAASVTVTNTGKFDGKEVVQWYIRDLVASLIRPVKELKGFNMVEIEAGKSKTISFSINKKVLKFYTANGKWEAENGDFKLFVGGSSNTTLEANFKLQ